MRQSFYPTTPPPAEQLTLSPSQTFNRNAFAVAIAIFLFCLLYLLLLGLSAGLVIGGIYGGATLIASGTGFFSSVAGVGLATLGVLFLAFFVKFALAVNQSRHPHRVEVIPEEQPRLYEFVKQLAEDTNAPLPQKIFLVPEVKTTMFHHSSFWNVFWPARKNLDIGLGLINVLSVSEFKAILAHEFGHFSSRGSSWRSRWYAINRTLYTLVYEYDNWDRQLGRWASRKGVVGFLSTVVHRMVAGARVILRWAYGIVNRHYVKLSLDMEHHADLVATSVVGHEAMVSALRRTELGAQAYERCSDYLDQLAKFGKRTDDLYTNHRTVLSQLAKQRGLTMTHGLPLVSEGGEVSITARINVENQWASHPSRSDREQNILAHPVAAEVYPQLAWKLLKSPTMLRRDATFRWYDDADQASQSLSASDFADFTKKEEQCRVSSAYHGFYDGRFLQRFDPKELIAAQGNSDSLAFEMVYNKTNFQDIARVATNQNDVETLMHIQIGAIMVGCFEFDHQKCSVQEAGRLIRLLNGDLARQKRWLTELDQQAFLCHYHQAQQAGVAAEYVARYQTLISLQEAYRNFSANWHQLMYWQEQQATYLDQEHSEVCVLTEELSSVEVSFKSNLLACASISYINSELTEARQQELVPYLRSEQAYYLKISEFDKDALARFNHLILDIWTATRQAYRQSLKSLTDYQLGLQVVEEVPKLIGMGS